MRHARHPAHPPADRGVAALEMVLVMPLLIALIVAIAQFGLYWSRSVEVSDAARSAARTLALRQTPSYPSGMSPSGVTTCAANDINSNSQVTVSASFTFSIPFVPLGTRTISSTARMRCGG